MLKYSYTFILFFLFSLGLLKTQPLEFTSKEGVVRSTFEHAVASTPLGVVKSFELKLPVCKEGYFISGDHSWPSNGNRTQMWHFENNVNDIFKVKRPIPEAFSPEREGYGMVLKLENDEYLYLLALTTSKQTSRINITKDGKVKLESLTWGTDEINGEFPLLSWARSKDFYQAAYTAWHLAVQQKEIKNNLKFREQKEYNEAFKYLGWCTWEQHKKAINENIIKTSYDELEKSDIPVRWILVDDGHQNAEKDNELLSFEHSSKKFPNGWDFLTKTDRTDAKIKWVGLWHCFDGLWKGINKKNSFKGLDFLPWNDKSNTLKVKGDSANIERFYDQMISKVKNQGFDFVKIDVQARSMGTHKGEHNAVLINHWSSHALEKQCDAKLEGLINCMAMNSACVFNTPISNVTRVSIDYKLGNKAKAKSHLYQSYASSTWLAYSVFPDHDMFHSSDENCGKMMAVSKAMSAAPIYLSDDPKTIVKEYISPLCFEDGELLRPLAPAVPLDVSLCKEVFTKPNAFNVVAPLKHKAAAIVAYNLTEPVQAVQTTVGIEDYQQASAMLQPYPGKWKAPSEGLVIFDMYEHKGNKLNKAYAFSLPTFQDKLMIVSPIDNGWAVIGATNKFLAPNAVDQITYSKKKLEVKLKEAEKFVFWSKKEPVCKTNKLTPLGNNFWELNVNTGQTLLVINSK